MQKINKSDRDRESEFPCAWLSKCAFGMTSSASLALSQSLPIAISLYQALHIKKITNINIGIELRVKYYQNTTKY